MSVMYRAEVPAYGTLLDLVARVNAETLVVDEALKNRLESTDSLSTPLWQPVLEPRASSGAKVMVLDSTAVDARFYRLRRP